MRILCSRSRARRAVAAVEFAFLAPVLITLLFGVWEVGRMIQMYQIVSNAAREGGRQAATAKYTNPQVQQTVLNYLLAAQVPASDTLPNSQVTLANTDCTITVQDQTTNTDVSHITVQITGSFVPAVPTLLFLSNTLPVQATSTMFSEGN
jgi:Flp pilus assembly protein TadG